MEHDSNEDPLKAVNSQVYARLDKTLRTSAPHLQDMRISQHLRSLSSFSEDQVVADMPVDVIHEPYDIEASATKPQQETSSEFCNDTATPSRMGSRQDELTALERSAKQLSLDIPELPGDADAVSLSKLITAATKRRYDLYVQSTYFFPKIRHDTDSQQVTETLKCSTALLIHFLHHLLPSEQGPEALRSPRTSRRPQQFGRRLLPDIKWSNWREARREGQALLRAVVVFVPQAMRNI